MLLTCMTIVQSFMLMVTMPLGGITSGTQTILGYNYGARRPERIKKAEVHIAMLGLVFTKMCIRDRQRSGLPSTRDM